ncbi:MAG: DUF6918 family protein [Myxococcota bacterium]
MSRPRSTAPTHADVLAQLGELPAEAVSAAAAEVDARSIAYPMGSGEAEEAALVAGLKPVVRQAMPAARVAETRRRLESLGLTVVDAAPGEILGLAPHLLFAGRDADRVAAAAACEQEAGPGHERRIGALLGYPPCCLEAFLAAPRPRTNVALARRALAATEGPCAGRLNMLDLGVFHYVSWQPCSFDCAPSREYADAVAALIRHEYGQAVHAGAPGGVRCPPGCQHERFVEAIDEALGAHRLWLADDVQVSLTGPFVDGALEMGRVWPTARDRHPDARLSPEARDAVARVLVVLRRGRRLAVRDGALFVDGARVLRVVNATLFPFGSDAAPGAEACGVPRTFEAPTGTPAEPVDTAALTLAGRLLSDAVRPKLLDDVVRLVDAELSRWSSLRGLALRAAYGASERVRPGWLRAVMDDLLDDLVHALEPAYAAWLDGDGPERFSRHVLEDGPAVTDRFAGVVDRHVPRARTPGFDALRARIRSRLRARVLDALPRATWVLDRHVPPHDA